MGTNNFTYHIFHKKIQKEIRGFTSEYHNKLVCPVYNIKEAAYL